MKQLEQEYIEAVKNDQYEEIFYHTFKALENRELQNESEKLRELGLID